MIGIGQLTYSAAEGAVFHSGHFPPSYIKMQYGEEHKCPLMHRQLSRWRESAQITKQVTCV